jgi:Zn-dependent protease
MPAEGVSSVSLSLAGVLVFVAFLFSVIAHEIAHGWVALKCGDPTAKWEGRLTANPIPHIDPFMSILLPLICMAGSGGAFVFGGAKPVPVNERNLRRWPLDPILVALAGIATNLLIALGCSIAFHALAAGGLGRSLIAHVLVNTAEINVFLAVFNLIPIPPLDGSRVFRFLLDGDARRSYMALERYGFFILVIAIQLPLVRNLVDSCQDLVERLLHLPSFGGGLGL